MTPRELNARRIRRATRGLVAASLVATALVAGAAAHSGARSPGAGAADDGGARADGDSGSTATLTPPESLPQDSSAPPAAGSGGS